MKHKIMSFAAVVVCVGIHTQARGAILDSAQRFGVLGGSTVTNIGPTIVSGDLGVWPGSAITGFPPGTVVGVIHTTDPVAQQAQADVNTAYNYLAGLPMDQNLSGQDLGGMTLAPGVYFFSSSASLGSTLTLDAQGNANALFVFQIGTTITTASSSAVVTINGAQGRNVYWQVGSSATLGSSTAFQGNILAMASITLNTGASLNGRALAIVGAVTLDSNAISSSSGVAMRSDFNGDGKADLAIGVPNENVGGTTKGGGVNVIYGGSAPGLTAAGAQFWSQNSADIVGSSASGDRFGSALAMGDFDGDGFSDLAVGIPFKNTSNRPNSGAVQVIYGSASGLNAAGNQLWTQDSPGINNAAGAGAQFGAALTVGDFNGDGIDDLAVGIPGHTIHGRIAAGAVAIIYGSASGLDAIGDQLWSLDSAGIPDAAKAGDAFGQAISSGDFNGDAYADLAIGAPLKDVGAELDAGVTYVVYGSATGLNSTDSSRFRQGFAGMLDTGDAGDTFGASLASGDFNGDSYGDLAIGAPSKDIDADVNTGAVIVIYGSITGLDSAGNQFWTQNSPHIANRTQDGDGFGSALAAGDFDNDGFADLTIGVPREGFTNAAKSGAVHCIYGSAGGLTSTDSQFWDSIALGLGLTPGAFAGASLLAADLNGDGYMDAVIGAPRASVSGKAEAGLVEVIYGSAAGLTVTDFQIWNQDSTGIPNSTQGGDNFGASLGT